MALEFITSAPCCCQDSRSEAQVLYMQVTAVLICMRVRCDYCAPFGMCVISVSLCIDTCLV